MGETNETDVRSWRRTGARVAVSRVDAADLAAPTVGSHLLGVIGGCPNGKRSTAASNFLTNDT